MPSRRNVLIILIVLLGVAAAVFLSSRRAPLPYESVVLSPRDVVQEVSVTGQVKPSERVDLAFEKTGRVAAVYVEVGQEVSAGSLLAQLEAGDAAAQLAEAEAKVKAERSRLQELRIGTRAEEIGVQEAKVEDAEDSVGEARVNMIEELRSAFITTDNGVRNKIDPLFVNARTENPEFGLETTDVSLRNKVELGREQTESTLVSWKASLDELTLESDLGAAAGQAKERMGSLEPFLDNLALLVNNLKATLATPQTTIDAHKTNVAQVRSDVQGAISDISQAEEQLRGARSALELERRQLVLLRAGSTPESVAAQEALVEQAEASAANYRAQLQKTRLLAPIAGVVVVQDADVGELVDAAATPISLISSSGFKMEANIPEADIAKVKKGDAARVTLDAYGRDAVFEAAVTAIDPAETVIEGVSTYKTTLHFLGNDERIRSGMTANIDIVTEKKEGVLAVPQRAVVRLDGETLLRLVEPGGIREVSVRLGVRGSDGTVEVVEGVGAGDEVVTFIDEEQDTASLLQHRAP